MLHGTQCILVGLGFSRVVTASSVVLPLGKVSAPGLPATWSEQLDVFSHPNK